MSSVLNPDHLKRQLKSQERKAQAKIDRELENRSRTSREPHLEAEAAVGRCSTPEQAKQLNKGPTDSVSCWRTLSADAVVGDVAHRLAASSETAEVKAKDQGQGQSQSQSQERVLEQEIAL